MVLIRKPQTSLKPRTLIPALNRRLRMVAPKRVKAEVVPLYAENPGGSASLVGYARTSTTRQALDLQIDALLQSECGRTCFDQSSGRSMERPGLNAALDRVDGKGRVAACRTVSRL